MFVKLCLALFNFDIPKMKNLKNTNHGEPVAAKLHKWWRRRPKGAGRADRAERPGGPRPASLRGPRRRGADPAGAYPRPPRSGNSLAGKKVAACPPFGQLARHVPAAVSAFRFINVRCSFC